MKIIELLENRCRNPIEFRPPLIACLGDSVTQGCFEFRDTAERKACRPHEGYCMKLQRRLSEVYPEATPTVLNAGIGGHKIKQMYERLDRDILSFQPDLVTLHVGLNDCLMHSSHQHLHVFRDMLAKTVDRILESHAELILITPNAMCTRIHENAPLDSEFGKYFPMAVQRQTEGWMDAFVEIEREVCSQRSIPVADVYAQWQQFIREGQDITCYFSNYINHPLPEYHDIPVAKILEAMRQ